MKTIIFITLLIFISQCQQTQNFDIQLFKKTFINNQGNSNPQFNFAEFQKMFFKPAIQTNSQVVPVETSAPSNQNKVPLVFDVETFLKAFDRKVESTERQDEKNRDEARINFVKFEADNLMKANRKYEIAKAQLQNFLSSQRFDYDKFRAISGLIQSITDTQTDPVVEKSTQQVANSEQSSILAQNKGAVVILDSIHLNQLGNLRKN